MVVIDVQIRVINLGSLNTQDVKRYPFLLLVRLSTGNRIGFISQIYSAGNLETIKATHTVTEALSMHVCTRVKQSCPTIITWKQFEFLIFTKKCILGD